MTSSDTRSTAAPEEAGAFVTALNDIVRNNRVGGRRLASPFLSETGRNIESAEQVIEDGLKVRALEDWLELCRLPRALVQEALAVPAQTTLHDLDAPLDKHVIERLMRLSELVVMAQRVFGLGAQTWLTRGHESLEGKPPLEVVCSDFGLARVRNMLVAIEHGGVV